jgi:hypothetical protein
MLQSGGWSDGAMQSRVRFPIENARNSVCQCVIRPVTWLLLSIHNASRAYLFNLSISRFMDVVTGSSPIALTYSMRCEFLVVPALMSRRGTSAHGRTAFCLRHAAFTIDTIRTQADFGNGAAPPSATPINPHASRPRKIPIFRIFHFKLPCVLASTFL